MTKEAVKRFLEIWQKVVLQHIWHVKNVKSETIRSWLARSAQSVHCDSVSFVPAVVNMLCIRKQNSMIRQTSKDLEASSSNGRAADSKSAGWGFESLLACHVFLRKVRTPYRGDVRCHVDSDGWIIV